MLVCVCLGDICIVIGSSLMFLVFFVYVLIRKVVHICFITTLSTISPTDGEIHLIAFHSRTFTLPKLNYDVHDKELLTIFEAFKIWRHYLKGSLSPVDMVTDHKKS